MKKKFTVTLNAPVVLGIVAISLVATILNYITAGRSGMLLFSTYRWSLVSPLTWIRAVTHVFGHADIAHFAGNMSYLLLLGPMLEEKYGSKTLCFAVVITALVTSLVNYIFFPDIALCGASGVVFAFIMLSSSTGFKEGEIPLTFILVAVFYIGQQVIDGITVRDNISNTAHIVGGIVGGVLGYGLNVQNKDRS